jgi:sulfite reductase (NADPH) flavoprotein alpha-component
LRGSANDGFHEAIGDTIALRTRSNPRFHTPDAAQPIILIGNGTGISALRAHLKARIAGTRNWLIYGERDPAHDRPFSQALDDWVGSGHLARCDRIFSRHGSPIRYVQHAVTMHADELRAWVEQGAAILVCGSLAMGAEVDAAVRTVLGPDRSDAMLAQAGYRRDVY